MSTYTPNSWNVIRINDEIDKVIGGWSGGYRYGDSYRVNSGITEIREFEDRYEFVGTTSSVYICYKRGEGLRGYAAMVLASMEIQAIKQGNTITVIWATEARASLRQG